MSLRHLRLDLTDWVYANRDALVGAFLIGALALAGGCVELRAAEPTAPVTTVTALP